MLATLSIAFTDQAESSKVLAPARQEPVAVAPEDHAQAISEVQLNELVAVSPPSCGGRLSQ